MRREDEMLSTIIIMVPLLCIIAAGIAIMGLFGTDLISLVFGEKVEQVTPETVVEETPIPTEQEQNSKIEPETQELSPEEIWKQEMDYVVGYIHGQMKYISYITIKNKYEFNPDDIPENTYQEYIKAAEQLLSEAMENPEISDESIERYNVVAADIYDEEYLRFDRESIMSMQGFQEGVIYYSYMEAVKELLYCSGEMTEEQYQDWFEEMLYGENELTHETIMERIEYSQKLLAQYGKENIPIPYFN